jgi:hypothetical protein
MTPNRFTPPCPICGKNIYGGMSLVRHLYDDHSIDYDEGNEIVDDLYELQRKSNMLPPPAQKEFTVQYEHLTADQCEKLKEKVRDKEKEFTWGTYGPKRDEELQQYTIDMLSTQHLENILITQPQISNETAAAILMLIKKRYGVL